MGRAEALYNFIVFVQLNVNINVAQKIYARRRIEVERNDLSKFIFFISDGYANEVAQTLHPGLHR